MKPLVRESSEPSAQEASVSVNLSTPFALNLSEIIRVLRKEPSSLYNNKDIDYSEAIFSVLDKLVTFIRNKSKTQEIVDFFGHFELLKTLDSKGLIHFIDGLRGFEDEILKDAGSMESGPKQLGDVELLRALFLAFGVLQGRKTGGITQSPSNPILDKYHSHKEGVSRQIFIDEARIEEFTPDIPADVQLFGSLRQEVGVTGVIELPVRELIASVESAAIKAIEKRKGDPTMSEYQEGAQRRRDRGRGIKTEKMDAEARRLDQEWYDGELEQLRALSSFLHERFEELRLHLIGNIPYVGEVLDYLSVIGKLKEKGYEVESLNVNEVRRDFARLTTDYERLIAARKSQNIKLAQDLSQLNDVLHTEPESGQSKLARRINKAKGKIQRNLADIKAYEEAATSHRRESEGIFRQVEGYRLSATPNLEQFKLGFHHSLRAEELYSAPDFVPEIPVSEAWIDENILPLFVRILSTYLGDEDVNIRNLYELMGRIDELPDEYSDGLAIPDTEGVSQAKAGDFFAMLLPLIPKEHLTEIPNLRTIVTPEGVYVPKELVKKEPKPKKTRSEKRAESNTRRTSIQRNRTMLIEELRTIEGSLKEHVSFWRERLIQNLKTRRLYAQDIEKIDQKIKLRRAFPHKSKEELEALIETSKAEEAEIRQRITGSGLKDDTVAYKKLIDDRAQISRRLARLK